MNRTATRPSKNGHHSNGHAQTPTPGPSPSEGNGRATNGQFTPGNKFARGNPHAKRVNELRKRLMAAVTDDAMDRIAAKLVALSEGGDLVAARLLFEYVLGKPLAAPDPDEVELGLHLWDLLQRFPRFWDPLVLTTLAMPPEFATRFVENEQARCDQNKHAMSREAAVKAADQLLAEHGLRVEFRSHNDRPLAGPGEPAAQPAPSPALLAEMADLMAKIEAGRAARAAKHSAAETEGDN